MEKSKKQIEVEKAIIDKMPDIQKDLLKIVNNVFKANPKFSERQLNTPYGLSMDILTLSFEWLADQYDNRSPSDKREKNKLKPHIGTWQE